MNVRANLKLRNGLVAAVQLLAFGYSIHAVARYGPTSLSIPGLLGVILFGEVIDPASAASSSC